MDSSFALIVAAAGTAAAWQARRWRSRRAVSRRIRQSLLKPAHRYFYALLRDAVDDCSIQVGVEARRVWSEPPRSRVLRALGGQCIDFLICDPETLAPKVAVLLRSEEENSAAGKRLACDQLRKHLGAAGLPCIICDAEAEYDVETLAELLPEEEAA